MNTHAQNKELQKKILIALHRYYSRDVTLERAANDENISIYHLIEYTNDHSLPVIHTEQDVVEGLQKVEKLMKKEGIKLEYPIKQPPSLQLSQGTPS